MAFLDLRRILTEMLPSPAMMEQAEVLRIQTQLEEIRRPLWAISAVILDAHLRAMALEERDLEDWIAEVGATMVDLEDLLESIIDRQERAMESGRNFSRGSSFLGLARLAFRVAILRKLKKMGRRLNDLVRRGSAFKLRREPMDSMDPLQDGYSAILEDEVKGRRVEYEQIVELLQQQEMHSTTEDEEYSSVETDAPFTIVMGGEEGMGKRTLARMIYHDGWVHQHFHHRLWVDASNFYYDDLVGIGREIARSMGHGNYSKTSSFQDMWVYVNQRLAGGRYLLILDGLNLTDLTDGDLLKWDEKWNELKRILLRVGGAGSAIIITISTHHLLLHGESFHLRLKGISENDWTELLMRWALGYQGPDQDKHKEEEDTARTIAMQIYKGNYGWRWYHQQNDDPLTAKLMGFVFRYIEIGSWQELANNSDLLKIIVNDRHQNLIKLYFHPTRYAHSIFYRTLFPDDDDNIFLSEEFMHLMIANDLLPLWSDKDLRLGYMEMIRRNYRYYWSRGDKTQYCSTINIGKDSPIIPKQCRHLCLHFSSNASTTLFPTLAQFKRNKLRTLILQCSREDDVILKGSKHQIPAIPEETFATLTYLHALHLQASKIQHIPSAIGRLRNLRYLNLSHTEIHTLSKSLWNLQNLRILNLAYCQNLEKLSRKIHKLGRLQILKLAYCEKLRMLPTTITNLANLQELDVEGCPWLVQLCQGVNHLKSLVELNMHNCVSLTQMPRGIGELTNLLRLLGYHANDEFGSALAELQSLVNLRELHLEKLERVWRLDEIIANLGLPTKTKLKYLTLRWQWWSMDLDSEARVDIETSSQWELEPLEDDLKLSKAVEGVHLEASFEHVQQLENLQPYQPNLMKLEIISYLGNKWPSWMLDVSPFESLAEIRLINLKRCERLPSLVQLLSLKIIEISGMDSIVDDFIGDKNIHGNLREFTFSEMPELEKLSIRSNSHMELKLIHCSKFRELDIQGLYCLKLKLWLNNGMMFTSEFKGWDNLLDVEELEIVGCQELKFLPQGMKNLHHLKKLTIISCNNLISLPEWMGEEFYWLKSLEICSCPALISIPTIPKMSLHKITIQGCPKLQLPDLPSHVRLQIVR